MRLLRRVRNIAHRFGGSHAQRDVLDLTLIEAAMRSGQQALADALSAERAAMRPTSPLSRAVRAARGADGEGGVASRVLEPSYSMSSR